MRTIGLIGGLSCESTLVYYKTLNEMARTLLGGSHSARLLLSSVDFDHAEKLRMAGDLQGLGDMLGHEATLLASSGASVIAICSNTMHLVYDFVTAATRTPVLHIADALRMSLTELDRKDLIFLGTSSSAKNVSYIRRILQGTEFTMAFPKDSQQELVDQVIYDRLCVGIVESADRMALIDVVSSLITRGDECVILGCTELDLLLSQGDFSIPLVDSTYEHCRGLLNAAMA